jgi:AcrR family transcriptional regulator
MARAGVHGVNAPSCSRRGHPGDAQGTKYSIGVSARGRRTSPPRATRDRLIEAAAELIAEEGYDRAGVQAIVRRAGLTNGAVYANFRDKSELLGEAIEVHLDRLFGKIEQARRAGASPAQVAERVIQNLALDTPRRDRRLLTEALTAASRNPDLGAPVRELLGRAEQQFANLFEQARADGDLAADVDPSALARFSTALALGFHLVDGAGAPAPERESWTRLMSRVAASLRA